jgi:hypothetical protein
MMKKDTLFDDIARVLASPMPRRQALATIMRGLAGAAVVSLFGPEVARADPTPDKNGNCPANHSNCNGVVCCENKTQTCCGTGATSACCRPPQTCVDGRCQTKASPSGPR